MRPVYPRWRGELLVVRRFEENKNGLSPLARGTRLNGNRHGLSWRFIPAGAGNSPAPLEYPLYIPVYPRWRGELAVDFAGVVSAGGLSPLARGTQYPYLQSLFYHRFIPAGAGNSECGRIVTPSITVYPRWRGELGIHELRPFSVIGLSPLARGTHFFHTVDVLAKRFIPAGAGNSMKLFAKTIILSVYPRWRGELEARFKRLHAIFGLSPLARGTLQCRCC